MPEEEIEKLYLKWQNSCLCRIYQNTFKVHIKMSEKRTMLCNSLSKFDCLHFCSVLPSRAVFLCRVAAPWSE